MDAKRQILRSKGQASCVFILLHAPRSDACFAWFANFRRGRYTQRWCLTSNQILGWFVLDTTKRSNMAEVLINLLGQTQCAVNVVINRPAIRAQSYDKWGIANAIATMCVRKGKDGVSTTVSLHSCAHSWNYIAGDTELAVWILNAKPGNKPISTG